MIQADLQYGQKIIVLRVKIFDVLKLDKNTITKGYCQLKYCLQHQRQKEYMRLVSSNLANYHATVQKLLIRQVLTKPMV